MKESYIEGSMSMPNRALTEKNAWKNGDVYSVNKKIKSWFQHVHQCPNTVEGKKYYREYVFSKSKGKSVLEVGCGTGQLARKVHENGAKAVCGVDISPEAIELAKGYEVKNQIEFRVLDLMEDKLEEKYDFIYGMAILHHLDWKVVIDQLYTENLLPGGSMIFYEPLRGNIFIRLYHLLFKGATTENEKQFSKDDINYLEKNYKAHFKFINCISLVTGVISSFVSKNPNNILMKFSNSLDNWLEKEVKISRSHFRCFSIIIDK